jgi:hypothetical protein
MFRIGSSNEHVMVIPSRRESPDVANTWDRDWVCAQIAVAAGGFRGEFEARLRTEEFVSFRDALRPLHEKLVGQAKFETMEGWLSVDVQGDGKGHFHADCVAVDLPGTGNRLTFGIDFDQTELREILRGLEAVADAFPVVG